MAASDGSRRKLQKTSSGLRMVAEKDSDRSPFELEEPPWTPDSEVPLCMKCDKKFDLMNRRHHCRRCGSCFCNKCCKHKMDVKRLYFVDPVRVCEACQPRVKKENDFFGKQLTTLKEGATFLLQSSALQEPGEQPSDGQSFDCKLTKNHRYIEFVSAGQTSRPHDNVEVTSIHAVQILTGGQDAQGNVMGTGLTIKYRDFHGTSQSLRLVAAGPPNRTQSMAWLVAMQKAIKMLYENRSEERDD